MDIKINLDSLKDLENNNIKIDAIKFQKMLLLYNSIEQGWSIKKRNDSYVFSKSHEGKKEILEDSYLLKFMKTNLDINKIFS
jgi:predicted transposase YbfD/YdcC